MKLLSICVFAVLFLFQAALGLHIGNAEIQGAGKPGVIGGLLGHAHPGPACQRGGGFPGPPPPPAPTNATASG